MESNHEFFLNDPKNNPEKSIQKAVNIGIDFIKSKNIKKPVVDFIDQKEIWNEINENLPKKGKKIGKILSEFKKKIMRNSVNFSNPRYLGFPDCGISTAAQIGHILSGMLNQNMINSITASPTGTFVDILLIQWMRKLLGFRVKEKIKDTYDVGGVVTFGGVASNTIGILLSREAAIKRYSKNSIKKFRIFVPSNVNHYSIERAIFWLGLDKKTLIFINIDKNFCLDISDLKRKIIKEKAKGNIPITIVTYAGNSKTMSIDNFTEIYKIAKKHKIWFHVDACHGFCLAFSKKLRLKIRGINLADSITLDPHKTLFVPYNLSLFLVKKQSNMKLISSKGNIVLTEPFSLGAMNPFVGSLAFNSLKLWFLIKNLGKNRLGKLVEERFNLILWFSNFLKKNKDFIVLTKPSINSCLFYFFPKKDRANITKNKISRYNQLSNKIFKKLFMEGEYYIHSFDIIDYNHQVDKNKAYNIRCLRVTIGNPMTTKKNLIELITNVKRIGNDLLKKENSL